jgi:hypothetical protein
LKYKGLEVKHLRNENEEEILKNQGLPARIGGAWNLCAFRYSFLNLQELLHCKLALMSTVEIMKFLDIEAKVDDEGEGL